MIEQRNRHFTCNNLKCFQSPYDFSNSTSFVNFSSDAPHLLEGTVKCRHRAAHSSKRLNTLSAIILLYLGSISKKPDFRVISLSLIPPVCAFDTNVIA